MTMSADTMSTDTVHVEVKKQTGSSFDEAHLKSYRRLREDYLWIFANKARLRVQYANEYIAVENKTVRFKSQTMEGIMSQITRSGQRTEGFAIEYIGEHPVNFLF
jgi:hypothetical protein